MKYLIAMFMILSVNANAGEKVCDLARDADQEAGDVLALEAQSKITHKVNEAEVAMKMTRFWMLLGQLKELVDADPTVAERAKCDVRQDRVNKLIDRATAAQSK